MLKTFSLIFGLVPLALCQFLPYEQGSYTVSRFNINNNETFDLPYNLDIWTPSEAGTYPIIFFLGSFGAILPGESYDVVDEHIASHGYIVVYPWLFEGITVSSEDLVPYFEQTIAWCKAYLDTFLYSNGIPTGLVIDYNFSFGLSHSAGGPIYVEYLSLHCEDFKGLILTSPVDGFGASASLPTEGYLNFSLPTFVLPAGLDNQPGINISLACGPEEISNKVFYDALNPSSHKWGLNSTEFGHADYMDQGIVVIVQSTNFCSYNEDATVQDFNTYRSFIGGQAVTFIKAIMSNGDCAEYLDIMENTANMPVAATATNYKPTPCPSPQCILYP